MGSAPMYVADIVEYFGVSRQVAAALLYRNVFGETRSTMCAPREAVIERDEMPLKCEEVAKLFCVRGSTVRSWLRDARLLGEPEANGGKWWVKFRAVLEVLGEHYGARLVTKATLKKTVELKDQVLQERLAQVKVTTPGGRTMYVLREEGLGVIRTPEERKVLAGLLDAVMAELRVKFEGSEKFEGFVEYHEKRFGAYLLSIFDGHEMFTVLRRNLQFVVDSLLAHHWAKEVVLGDRRFFRLADFLGPVDPDWLDEEFDKSHEEQLRLRAERVCLWLSNAILDGSPSLTPKELHERMPFELVLALCGIELKAMCEGGQSRALTSWAECAAAMAGVTDVSE